jgi:hypothetical protein
VRRLYYVAVGEPGYVEGIRASTRQALWCELGLRCRRLLPAVFAGWARRDGGGSRGGEAHICVAAVRYAVPASLATRYGSVADASEWVNVGDVIEPRVEPEAVWSPFSLYEFSGWRIDGFIVRRIAVAGPVAGWTLNFLPAAALAGSTAVVFLLWRWRP